MIESLDRKMNDEGLTLQVLAPCTLVHVSYLVQYKYQVPTINVSMIDTRHSQNGDPTPRI